MASISPPGIRPASFPFIFIHINPTAVKTFLQDGQIFLPQRGQALLYNGFGLLIGITAVKFSYHGHIQVVHMKRLHAQKLFAQSRVAVKLWKVIPHRPDQIIINQFRDLIFRQVILSDGLIFLCPGIEHGLFDIGGKCS